MKAVQRQQYGSQLRSYPLQKVRVIFYFLFFTFTSSQFIPRVAVVVVFCRHEVLTVGI